MTNHLSFMEVFLNAGRFDLALAAPAPAQMHASDRPQALVLIDRNIDFAALNAELKANPLDDPQTALGANTWRTMPAQLGFAHEEAA